MKKFNVNRGIPTVTIKVEKVLRQTKFGLGLYPEKKITVIRPYYQIRDEFGKDLLATSSFGDMLNNCDEFDENGDHDYSPYIQDETYVDGVLIGLKNQRLVNGWY